MFNRNGKQYIWPYILLVIIVMCFVPWILDPCLSETSDIVQNMHASHVTEYFMLTWLPTLGNVLIVALLLGWFGGPMIADMLKDRKQTIEHDIDEAARAKSIAEVEYADAESKLSKLDNEVKEMKASYKQALADERQNIAQETIKQQERLKNDADVIFELQSGVATRTFEREIMSQALDKARDQIVERLANDPSLRDKLIDQGIASLNLN